MGKANLTRRLNKAKLGLVMLQTNPPPTFKLMQQFITDKEHIEGLLDDLDGYYGDICLCDPTNTQGYMDKCEEQHIRCHKPIADLMDAANALDVSVMYQ